MSNYIKLLIVGGCFPVQDNIEPSLLYHQLLKKNIEKSSDVIITIKIIRYDSISGSYEKIKEAIMVENPDWILFHLRTEPILLSSKLYSKYVDKNSKFVRQFHMERIDWNFRWEKSCKGRETYFQTSKGENKIFLKVRIVFREINYFLGLVLGNWNQVFKNYLTLSVKLLEYCKSLNKILIITSPIPRPRSLFENLLSYKLHKFMNDRRLLDNETYVNLYDTFNKEEKFLFCGDLIKVNEIGHKRVSEILFPIFSKKLDSHIELNNYS